MGLVMGYTGWRGVIAAAAALWMLMGWMPAGWAKEPRCADAKRLVKERCGPGTMSTQRVSEARCTRAQAWLRERCGSTARITPTKPLRAKRGYVLNAPIKPRLRRAIRAARFDVLYALPPVAAERWHGRRGSCCGTAVYLYGRRYDGGSPRSPAGPFNNFEGGFHPTVFWQLQDRFPYGR
jgi:hypothetical protein